MRPSTTHQLARIKNKINRFSGFETRILLLFLLISALFASWDPTQGNSRLDTTRSIVEDGDIEISEYANNTIDKVEVFGRAYSDKAPGSSLAAVPIYYIFDTFLDLENDHGKVASYDKSTPSVDHPSEAYVKTDPSRSVMALRFSVIFLLSSVPAGITVLMVNRLLKEKGYSRRPKNLAVIGMALGTPILYYSSTFLGNTLAMFFGFLSFYIIQTKKTSPANVTAAGASLGAASIVEYYYLAVAPFLAYCLIVQQESHGSLDLKLLNKAKRPAADYLKGFLPVYLVIPVHNWLTTGSFIAPPKLLTPSLYQGFVPESLKLRSSGQTMIGPFILSNETPEMVFRLLFGPGRGLFVFSPFLLLGALGLYYSRKSRKHLSRAIFGIFVSCVLFNSMYPNWFGGGYFGPRYLVIMMPFLSIPAANIFERAEEREALQAVAVAVLAVSVGISFLGFSSVSLGQVNPDRGDSEILETSSKTYEHITGVEPALNPLPVRFSEFMEDGFDSPLVNNIGSPETNLNTFFSSNSQIAGFGANGEYLVLDSTWLELLIVGVISTLLTGLKPGYVPGHRLLRLMLAAAMILMFVAVSTDQSRTYLGDGWYDSGSSQIASKNAEINLHSGKRGFVKMSFYPRQDQNLTIHHDQSSSQTNYTLIKNRNITLPVRKGENKYSVKSNSCKYLYNTNNSSSVACVSYSLRVRDVESRDKAETTEVPLRLRMSEASERDEIQYPESQYRYGWYRNPDESGNWMTDRAEIAVASNRSGWGILKAEVRPAPGPETRVLTVSTPDWSGEFNMTGLTKLRVPFKLEEGFNEILFNSSSRCTRDRAVSNGRCIRFNFDNLSAESRALGVNTKSVFKPVDGWYPQEDTKDDLKRMWMGNKSKIRMLSNKETVELTVTSFNKPRNLTVTAGDKVREYVVGDGRSEIEINIPDASQKISMESRCSVPENVTNSSDTRCLSIAVLEKIKDINYDGSTGYHRILRQR